jgi:hypothetical protein
VYKPEESALILCISTEYSPAFYIIHHYYQCVWSNLLG